MLRYLRWLSISGVWGPLAILAGWFAVTTFAPYSAGWGLAVLEMLLVFASAHALAVSSLVGLCLLATGNSSRVAMTAVSAVVGSLGAALVLARIYFDVGA